MKATGFLAFVGLASVSSAHYTWDKITLNGQQVGRDNQYIRKHDNYYLPIKFKNTPEGSITPTNADFVCNKGAEAAPDVLKVKAGDKVGLKLGFGAKSMEHPGPVQMYVSPVTDAKSGNGEQWFKIHQALICRQGSPESLRTNAWCMWGEDSVSTTIPDTLPNGQYILRGEHIALHGAHDGQAEFYVACAQIEVTGSTASSIPGTSVKIPGVYSQSDKSVNFSVWGRSTSYDLIPGPDVIPGGTVRGSASGAGGDQTTKVAGGSNSGNGNSGASNPAPPANNAGSGNNNNNGGSQQPSKPSTPKPTSSKPAAAAAAAATTPASTSAAPAPAPTQKPCNRRRKRSLRHRALRAKADLEALE